MALGRRAGRRPGLSAGLRFGVWGCETIPVIAASRSPQTLGPADRRRRNRAIAAARATGSTWPEIAKRFHISERQARRGASEARTIQAEVLDVSDAEELVVEVVAVQRRALDVLSEMLTADLDNDAARVGAVRTAGSLGLAIHETLIRSGLLPPTGAEARFNADVHRAVQALVEAAKDLGVSPADVERRLGREPVLALGAA